MRIVTADLGPLLDGPAAAGYVAAAEAALTQAGGLPVVVHLTVHSRASGRPAVRATITDGPLADSVPFVVGETPRELAYKLEQLLTNLVAQR